MKCPHCRLINLDTVAQCECGYDFVWGAQAFSYRGAVRVQNGGRLPERCVKCNGPSSGGMMRQTFVENSITVPRGAISGILYLATRRRGQVHFSLCLRHRHMRWFIYWGCSTLLAIAAAATVIAIYFRSQREAMFGTIVACLIGGLLPLGTYQQYYLGGKLKGHWIELGRAGREFIESLPSMEEVAKRQSELEKGTGAIE